MVFHESERAEGALYIVIARVIAEGNRLSIKGIFSDLTFPRHVLRLFFFIDIVMRSDNHNYTVHVRVC